ncbi:MAG TPA: hypothetical protein VGL02_19895, partial [Streptomyces sp.]
MSEAAHKDDVRRAWLEEDTAGLAASRVAKHRLAEQVRRLVDAVFQLDAGDVGYDHAAASGPGPDPDPGDSDRAAHFMALAADAEDLADRISALPRIPRTDAAADGVNASLARRHDTLLVERSTINGRGNPLAPPVRMWADGELIRGEAFFTAPYE